MLTPRVKKEEREEEIRPAPRLIVTNGCSGTRLDEIPLICGMSAVGVGLH
jgi:hypothetical protein